MTIFLRYLAYLITVSVPLFSYFRLLKNSSENVARMPVPKFVCKEVYASSFASCMDCGVPRDTGKLRSEGATQLYYTQRTEFRNTHARYNASTTLITLFLNFSFEKFLALSMANELSLW